MFIFADLWFIAFFSGFSALAILITEFGGLLALSALVVSFIALSKYFFEISIIGLIVANPLLIVAFMAGYITLGVGYTGLWRWPSVIKSKTNDIHRYFESYCKHYKVEQNATHFDAFIDSPYYQDKFSVKSNKEVIMVWVMLWPFALFWELTHKPISRLWNAVYRGIASSFTKIGTNTAKKHARFDKH